MALFTGMTQNLINYQLVDFLVYCRINWIGTYQVSTDTLTELSSSFSNQSFLIIVIIALLLFFSIYRNFVIVKQTDDCLSRSTFAFQLFYKASLFSSFRFFFMFQSRLTFWVFCFTNGVDKHFALLIISIVAVWMFCTPAKFGPYYQLSF